MKSLTSIIKNFFKKEIAKDKPEEIPKLIFERVGPTNEELQEIAENLRKYTLLSKWMGKYADEIFAKAPNNEIYAVGIYRDPPTKPEIRYFNSKYTKKSILNIFKRNKLQGTLDFMIESNKKGEVNALIYKYQDQLKMMLACG